MSRNRTKNLPCETLVQICYRFWALTDEMAKSSAKLDFWLNKGVAIVFKSHQENLLHLDCKLTQTGD
jgi:hypothetical protein